MLLSFPIPVALTVEFELIYNTANESDQSAFVTIVLNRQVAQDVSVDVVGSESCY